MTRRISILGLVAALWLVVGTVASNRASAASATGTPRAKISLVHAGYLTVGSDTTYPPMESRNPRTGQYEGADIDLGGALAKAMGLKVKIVTNSYDSIIPALRRGNFDVIMSSMNDTPEREKQIAFVDYMKASEAIVVKSSSSIHANGYSGMCGHSVAVESGTTELFGLQAANKKCSSKIDIKPYTQDTSAFQAFASGHADAYTGDLPVAALYVKNHNGSLRLAGKPFAAGQDYGIGVLKSNKGLISALRTALAKIRANGQYAAILKKWGVGAAGL